jgi:tetratricopeptide (TPR) repeat protein
MIEKKCILFYIVIIFLFMSCASRRQHRLNHEKHVGTDAIKKEVESLVQKGNYTEAIELIGDVDNKSRSEIQHSALYIAALNGLADSGMDFYKAGDYKRAGGTFQYVIEHMPSDGAINNKFKKSSEQIRSLIIICEDRMMKQGLAKYRDGNLGDAITIWKEILKLNPNHTEAKKALKTATVQLKNLEKIESK